MTSNENVFIYRWKIENFSMLPCQVGERIESSKFVVDFLKEKWVCFSLLMYPKGINGNQDDFFCYIQQFLRKSSTSSLGGIGRPPDQNIFFKITLESTDPNTEISTKSLVNVNKDLSNTKGLVRLHTIFNNRHLYLPQDILTLRCDIKVLNKSLLGCFVNDQSTRYFKNLCTSRTNIKIHRRSVIWPIQNIQKHLRQKITTNYNVTSPIPNSPTLDLSLIFDKISSDGCIQIEIKQKERENIFVKCKIIVISAHKKFQESEDSSHRFSFDDNVWKFPAFLKASNLTRDKYLCQDDTLLLQCDFAFVNDNATYDMESNYMPFPFEARQDDKTDGLDTIVENFYQNEKFSDIKLKTQSKTFPFYKVILCSRSPVFRAMFENEMKEQSSNVVEITDVDSDTLNRLLTFMCTATIKEDLSFEDACKLYRAADKYDVASLKSWCVGLLASSLCVASVCDVLVLADTHQDNILIIAVDNFIRHHKEIFHSTYWKIVMEENPKLAMETMLKYL